MARNMLDFLNIVVLLTPKGVSHTSIHNTRTARQQSPVTIFQIKQLPVILSLEVKLVHNRLNPKDLEPAAIYLRKSREDQEAEARGEGETLARHKKALFQHAKALGVSISHVFEEIVSGESLFHRPEMLETLRQVEEGRWKSIWCMDVDRLGRGGMQDQGIILDTFKKANTKIVTPRKIYDLNDEFDEEYTEFEAFMARKELKIITRRLQGGRLRSVTLDKNYLGARPPYGYLIEKKGKSRSLIPHPDQANVVKLIFELYTEHGMGGNKIAKELNRLGEQTYTGKPWESSTVLFILKNEVYTGRLQWKKKEEKKSKTPGKKEDVRTRPREEWIDIEGTHEPLISKQTFQKAQDILKKKYHVPYQLLNGITNPLAGIIKCDMCGNSIVYRPYSNQRAHLMCYNSHCRNKSTRFEFVEEQLLEGLQQLFDGYKAQWDKHNSKPEQTDTVITMRETSLKNLQKELSDLQQQKDRLHDFLERGIYDEATYLERSRKLSTKIQETESAISETEQILAKELGLKQAHDDILPNLEHALTTYRSASDPAAKNEILKSVLEYATYRKEKHQQGDDFTLVLYPRIPR